MAQHTLHYIIYNLFPDQEPQFIEAFQETVGQRKEDGCRYELARAQGKAANYVLRIESDGDTSPWLNEPLRWFISAIVSATVYERIEQQPGHLAVTSH